MLCGFSACASLRCQSIVVMSLRRFSVPCSLTVTVRLPAVTVTCCSVLYCHCICQPELQEAVEKANVAAVVSRRITPLCSAGTLYCAMRLCSTIDSRVVTTSMGVSSCPILRPQKCCCEAFTARRSSAFATWHCSFSASHYSFLCCCICSQHFTSTKTPN